MVERPIKKSERQTAAPKSDVGEEKGKGNAERLDSTTGRSFQKKDRSKGRGKGSQQESGPSNVNPALVRGKKPTKPKPPVLEEKPSETETVEDSVTDTETPQETTTEE